MIILVTELVLRNVHLPFNNNEFPAIIALKKINFFCGTGFEKQVHFKFMCLIFDAIHTKWKTFLFEITIIIWRYF